LLINIKSDNLSLCIGLIFHLCIGDSAISFGFVIVELDVLFLRIRNYKMWCCRGDWRQMPSSLIVFAVGDFRIMKSVHVQQ
jgi:hypothetical protein